MTQGGSFRLSLTNYQRENEVTQAVLDRIIFKCDVGPSTNKNKRIKIYENYLTQPNFVPPKLISLAKLKEFTALVEKPNTVKFSKQILETYDYLLEEYTKESKKYISPRTANKALRVLKASALLNEKNNDLSYLVIVY